MVYRHSARPAETEWVLRMLLALPGAGAAEVGELGSALGQQGRFLDGAAVLESGAQQFPQQAEALGYAARGLRAPQLTGPPPTVTAGSYRGSMGTFAEMFPGRKLGRVARDEDSDGEGHGLPEGPLDLDSGVVRMVPVHDDEAAPDETRWDETQRNDADR